MHATPRPLIVPLFSSLSPLLFFLFYPLRLILARSCNRLVCYSREPINISFKCPFKRTKIVENRWKIRIDTRLVYNTKWYTDVTNSRIIRLWRRGKIIIILRYSSFILVTWFHLSDYFRILERYSPLLSSVETMISKREFLEHRKKKKIGAWAARDRLSRKLLGYIRNKGERKRGGSRVFHARIGTEKRGNRELCCNNARRCADVLSSILWTEK